MIWDELIGQLPAKAYLRSCLSAGRLAHAYLFQGPAGVGKRTAARIFAQAALCHRRPAGVALAALPLAASENAGHGQPTAGLPVPHISPDDACGACRSCRWFAARKGALIEHPDVVSLIKISKGEQGGEKLVGDHEPVIRLETIQYVCEQLHRAPNSGPRRAVIIPEAQRLCRGQAEAANAFLKTLEEPPPSALILLTSSQPEALLETIVSRVQSVQFRRLSAAEIRAGIERYAAGRSGEESELAAALADGSLGRALELFQGDLRTWRGAVLKALREFSPQKSVPFAVILSVLAETEGARLFAAEKGTASAEADEPDDDAQAEEAEVKTEAGWKRYVLRRLLELCELVFRDALLVAATGQTALLRQPDQAQLAKALAERFGAQGCEQVLAALREALLAVRLYVRGDVVARALAGKMCEAMGV